ncbi:MAG: YppF family protein [Bacillota bacterium]|nr:YppF family protein [Bacillota bacterium]MDP4171572.1 YppF family protein [Bacillota bacterium]
MDIQELQTMFTQSRAYPAEDMNELMSFAKKAYIHNELSFKEYRKIVRELENQGAEIMYHSDDDTSTDEEK